MNILLADDEIELADAIAVILESSGYKVKTVYNGEAVLKEVIKNRYDVILIDIMMPKMNGLEVVKELRNRNIDIPVLMLTAKSTIEDKVEGLDSGANDYLTKPFNKKELLARVRAITRESKNKSKKIEIGNVILDRQENEIYGEMNIRKKLF